MAKPYSEDLKRQWEKNILKQRQSKLSIASWCRQNNFAAHVFYYWQSKLFAKTAFDRSSFLESVEEKIESSGIVLEYHGIKLHIEEHFNSAVLKKCLEVLKAC